MGYSWIVEDNIFNRIVSEEAAYIEDNYKQNQTLVKPRAPFLTLYDEWNQLPQEIYLQHLKDLQQVEFKTADGKSIYVQPLAIDGSTAVLVADISKYEVGKDYLPIVFLSLVALLLIIISAALITAYLLAKNAIKPLRILTEKVQQTSIVEKGFAEEFPNNEVGLLAETIEDSFHKVQSLLKREENFTRDVSHELRTPITVLKNVIADLKNKPELSAKQLSYLNESTNQMEQTIATLLALAREESGILSHVKLMDILEDCIVSHYELSKRDNFVIDLDLSSDLKVMANENLLTLLVNNLLSNALQYASSSHLLIKADTSAITFENDTSYIHAHNPLEPNVKRNSSHGLGLGLYLVKRVCQVFGWEVEVSVEAERFRLTMSY